MKIPHRNFDAGFSFTSFAEAREGFCDYPFEEFAEGALLDCRGYLSTPNAATVSVSGASTVIPSVSQKNEKSSGVFSRFVA